MGPGGGLRAVGSTRPGAPMTPADVQAALVAAGLPPRPLTRLAVGRVPLGPEDRALLTRCGLPPRAQPGYLRFVWGTGARAPQPLCTLAQVYPRLRDHPRAQARVVLAKDGSGSLLWIDSTLGRAVQIHDTDVGRPVLAASSLAHLLLGLAAYRAFQAAHGDAEAPWPAPEVPVADLRALRDQLRALDPPALAGPEGLWPRLFEGRRLDPDPDPPVPGS